MSGGRRPPYGSYNRPGASNNRMGWKDARSNQSSVMYQGNGGYRGGQDSSSSYYAQSNPPPQRVDNFNNQYGQNYRQPQAYRNQQYNAYPAQMQQMPMPIQNQVPSTPYYNAQVIYPSAYVQSGPVDALAGQFANVAIQPSFTPAAVSPMAVGVSQAMNVAAKGYVPRGRAPYGNEAYNKGPQVNQMGQQYHFAGNSPAGNFVAAEYSQGGYQVAYMQDGYTAPMSYGHEQMQYQPRASSGYAPRGRMPINGSQMPPTGEYGQEN